MFDSLQGRHHLLPSRCQVSQYCSGPWAIRQLTVKLIRKSLGAQEKSGHHKVSGRNQEVSGVVRSARLCVTCQHLLPTSSPPPLGHMSNPDPDNCSNTSATNNFLTIQKAASVLSHRPNSALRFKTSCTTGNFIKAHFAVSAAKLAALFFANVKPPTSLVPCSSSRFWCWPTVHSPIRNRNSRNFGWEGSPIAQRRRGGRSVVSRCAFFHFYFSLVSMVSVVTVCSCVVLTALYTSCSLHE